MGGGGEGKKKMIKRSKEHNYFLPNISHMRKFKFSSAM